MTSYTKGPWRVIVENSDSIGIVQLGAERYPIALVDHRFNLSDPTKDAHLIAAAPELYEALKKAAFRLNKIKASGISDESLTLPIIEAAIAKAEGKA